MSGTDYAAALEAHSHAMEVRASTIEAVTDYHLKASGIEDPCDPELVALQTELRAAEAALNVARDNVRRFR